MKTIEQGLNEAYKLCGNNAYFGEGFKAGVEFAEYCSLLEDPMRTHWSQIEIK